jgi:ABC-type dipeptide/oligopeptide/nickel transport system permease component
VVFFVIRLIPGDPAVVMLGGSATEEQLAVYRAAHGLDRSALTQLWIAFQNLLRGDLGESLSHMRPVSSVIFSALPSTMELAAIGIVISTFVAIVLGVIAAKFRGRWPDIAINIGTTVGTAFPTFFIGLWILVIFALKLKVIPVLATQARHPHWQTLLGPVLTMVLGGSVARTCRSAMLEIMDEDFIRTARSKGLSERTVLYKHALGNALIPIVTMVGYGLATSVGGAVVLETVFMRNGVGKVLIDAISNRDYPLIQGATLIIASFMIVANLITDIVTGLVDPRIRVAAAT